jgi:hypothetical protein
VTSFIAEIVGASIAPDPAAEMILVSIPASPQSSQPGTNCHVEFLNTGQKKF